MYNNHAWWHKLLCYSGMETSIYELEYLPSRSMGCWRIERRKKAGRRKDSGQKHAPSSCGKHDRLQTAPHTFHRCSYSCRGLHVHMYVEAALQRSNVYKYKLTKEDSSAHFRLASCSLKQGSVPARCAIGLGSRCAGRHPLCDTLIQIHRRQQVTGCSLARAAALVISVSI